MCVYLFAPSDSIYVAYRREICLKGLANGPDRLLGLGFDSWGDKAF